MQLSLAQCIWIDGASKLKHHSWLFCSPMGCEQQYICNSIKQFSKEKEIRLANYFCFLVWDLMVENSQHKSQFSFKWSFWFEKEPFAQDD